MQVTHSSVFNSGHFEMKTIKEENSSSNSDSHSSAGENIPQISIGMLDEPSDTPEEEEIKEETEEFSMFNKTVSLSLPRKDVRQKRRRSQIVSSPDEFLRSGRK